jgi:cation:H+ antiporter
MSFFLLFLALVVILIGAETFTNALEHVGERLKISEGVTGSIFAAVGTAMPETMVPVIALFSGIGTQTVREEVSIGAILGAPLMLSTVAFCVMAIFAARRRGLNGEFHPERSGVRRDLSWFLIAFSLCTLAAFIPPGYQGLRATIALVLILLYFLYLMQTIRASKLLVADGHGTEADHPLYVIRLMRRLRIRENWFWILFQLAVGFGLIVLGARGFVYGVEELSTRLGISALVLSLIIIPIATELPEKVNSVLWIRRRRDTLAFGNITGAMMFQGSLIPVIGILLTPWAPHRETIAGMILTLVASAYLLFMLNRGRLKPYHLMFNGLCYLAYFVWIAI